MKYISFYFIFLVAFLSLVFGCEVPKVEESKETTYSAKANKQKPKKLKPKPLKLVGSFFSEEVALNPDAPPRPDAKKLFYLVSRYLVEAGVFQKENRANFMAAMRNEEASLASGEKKLFDVLKYFSDKLDTYAFTEKTKHQLNTALENYYSRYGRFKAKPKKTFEFGSGANNFSTFFSDRVERDTKRARQPLRPLRETNQLMSRMRTLLKEEGMPLANRGNFFNAMYNEETALLNGEKQFADVLRYFADAMNASRFDASLKYSVNSLLDDYYLEFKPSGAAFTPLWKREVNALFDEAEVTADDRVEFFTAFEAVQNADGSAFARFGLTSKVNEKLNEFKRTYSEHREVFSKVQAALPEPYNFPKPTSFTVDGADYSGYYKPEGVSEQDYSVLETAQVFTELLASYLPYEEQETASERAAKLMGLAHDFVYYGKEYAPFSEALLNEGVLDFDRDTLRTYAREWKREYEEYVEATKEPEEDEEECGPTWFDWAGLRCRLGAEVVSAEESADPRNTEVTRTSELSTADEVAEEAGLFKYGKYKFTTWVHAAVFAHYRTDTDYTDTVRALVAAGEDVDAPNRDVTALFEAVHWHNNGGNDMLSMVLALLKAGADPHNASYRQDKQTPFETAELLEARYPNRNHDYVLALFEFWDEGFDGRADGETLLHFAVRKDWNNEKDYSFVVYALATGGEDVQDTTFKSTTPLVEAVVWHNYKGYSTVETVQALLDAGADKHFETPKGTAYDLAKHMERVRPHRDFGVVVSTLEEH